jgi:PEP-CTERM motif
MERDMNAGVKKFSTALLLLGGATAAHAANFAFNYAPFYFGGGVDAQMVNRPPAMIDDGKAGAFWGSLSNAPGYSLLSSSNPLMGGVGFTFCVELTQQVVFGLNPSYAVLDPATSAYASWGANAAGISNHIDRLMSLALPAVAAAPDAAILQTRLGALQLSIWEVIYDYNPAFSYSLGGGILKFSSSADVMSQSSAWLAASALSAAVPTAHYAVLSSAQTQDLLVVTTPVPEPQTGLLMAMGMFGMFGMLGQKRLNKATLRRNTL